MDTKELQPIKRKVENVYKEAFSIVIKDENSLKEASDLLIKIKETAKAVQEKKYSIVNPLNQSLKSIRELFKPLEEKYEQAENVIKEEVVKYQQKKIEKIEATKNEINKKFESGKIDFGKAVQKIENIGEVNNQIEGEGGSLVFRENTSFKIIDVSKIPKEYFILDEVKIRKDIMKGIEIPGVEMIKVKTVVINNK